MTDYTVISASSVADLIKEVKKKCAEGYSPTGGITIDQGRESGDKSSTYYDNGKRYLQAIFK